MKAAIDIPDWFGTARKYATRVAHHDMAAVRRSIVLGRVAHKDAMGKRGRCKSVLTSRWSCAMIPDRANKGKLPMPHPKIYRVAELTRLIKTVLEDEVGELWVEGELSNFRQPASGHWYFTLKDESAQLALVMFRGNQIGRAHV